MKNNQIALIGLVLIAIGMGYLFQILTSPINVEFTIVFVLLLLILYVILKDVRIK